MDSQDERETINCLYCNEEKHLPWAFENGYTAVKCPRCGLVYVNPRPSPALITEAVKTGVHSDVGHGRTAIVYRVGSKIGLYKRILKQMFNDIWMRSETISWLDVGAGYGEFVEAVSHLAPQGSKIVGIEPMKPKAENARARGLDIRETFLSEIVEKFQFLSLINVFSHIPDFREFLRDVKAVLTDDGELFIETGNIADLISPQEVPTDLDLPDHLVFAGERHILGYLQEAGFSVIYVKRRRKDGLINVIKNIARKILGRKVALALPYTSTYRTLLIRAKLLD